MKLTFLGAAREVTGSCTQVEAAGHCFLVDCGMEQGRDIYENTPLPFAPGRYEALLAEPPRCATDARLPIRGLAGCPASPADAILGS